MAPKMTLSVENLCRFVEAVIAAKREPTLYY